jgi:hypothetical protein
MLVGNPPTSETFQVYKKALFRFHPLPRTATMKPTRHFPGGKKFASSSDLRDRSKEFPARANISMGNPNASQSTGSYSSESEIGNPNSGTHWHPGYYKRKWGLVSLKVLNYKEIQIFSWRV